MIDLLVSEHSLYCRMGTLCKNFLLSRYYSFVQIYSWFLINGRLETVGNPEKNAIHRYLRYNFNILVTTFSGWTAKSDWSITPCSRIAESQELLFQYTLSYFNLSVDVHTNLI
jgi:hypothetical protein